MATRTLGIDLASRPENTACCEIEWEERRGRIVDLTQKEQSLDDNELLRRMAEPGIRRTAIDAPFGWPAPFVAALSSYGDGGEWPIAAGDYEGRAALYLRETDRLVAEVTAQPDEGSGDALRAKIPLSVSTDKIAIPAMRCAGILVAYASRSGTALDRSGRGKVAEVYPDAALRQWLLLPREWDVRRVGYKGGGAAKVRRHALVDSMVERLAKVVDLEAHAEKCKSSDDMLDALVCALVARAIDLGATIPIPGTLEAAASAEGWIHLPRRGSLDRLA